MKKIYIEPKAVLFNLDIENPLCTATPVGGNISSDNYPGVNTEPIEDDPGYEPPITAKANDDLWTEDDDE